MSWNCTVSSPKLSLPPQRLPLPPAPSCVSPAKHFLKQINMQGGTKGILSRISTLPRISHSNIQLDPSEIKSTALKRGEARTSQANSSSFPFIPVLAEEAEENSITVVAPRCHRPRTPGHTGTALTAPISAQSCDYINGHQSLHEHCLYNQQVTYVIWGLQGGASWGWHSLEQLEKAHCSQIPGVGSGPGKGGPTLHQHPGKAQLTAQHLQHNQHQASLPPSHRGAIKGEMDQGV